MHAIRRFRRAGAMVVLVAGLLVLTPHVGGQPPKGPDKDFTGAGQVKIGAHKVRMEVGKLYLVKVEARGFTPTVGIRPGNFLDTGESVVADDTFRAYVLPRETREYLLTVLPSTDDDEVDTQLLDYAVTVSPIPMAREPLVNEKARLAATDPVYKNPGGTGDRGPHKAFTVNFKAGQVYIVTVNADNTREFDPFLQIEGAGGKVLAQDDDGGGDLNSRIFFKPKRGGEHRLVVTAMGKGTGGFTVKVLTTAAAAAKGDATEAEKK